jgi:cyclic pyranopterin monophosphate synthase
MEKRLTHIDKSGKATMVDVGHKADMYREATAIGHILLAPETVDLIRSHTIRKGDVLTTAEIAAIQAAKRTPELIPLCHHILLSSVQVNTTLLDDRVVISATARCNGKTGVEMEALTAVSVGLLTIYDMCKAVDKGMVIEGITLKEKLKKEIGS